MSKSFITTSVLVALVLAAVAAVLAYDGARTERIAQGITVGGVDIGGMEPAAARARLQTELVAALQKPVTVNYDDGSWRLSAREARVQTNATEMVDDAVRRSRDGGILGRSYRRLTDGSIDADLQPVVTFSDRAVVRLMDRVRREVERPAKDARVSITGAGVDAVEGRRGLKLRTRTLHKAINAALVSPQAERRFFAKTRKVRPKVTTQQLIARNPVVLIADRGANTLRVYKRLKLAKTYGIAAGQAQYPTPAGSFTIANKAVNPTWSVPNSTWAGDLDGTSIPGGAPDNPLKARWMGITDGVGIHGTSDAGSIGSNASHGCLRMNVSDVIELYPQVPVGAKILIT